MGKRKATKEEIEERRSLVAHYIARGMDKPARILSQKKMSAFYNKYRSPYTVVIKDIEFVKRENQHRQEVENTNFGVGEYKARLEEQFQQCWADYPRLSDNAKVGMMKFLFEVSKALARCSGVNPDNLDPKPLSVNVNNTATVEEHNYDPPEGYLEALEKYNDLFGVEDDEEFTEETASTEGLTDESSDIEKPPEPENKQETG